MLNTTWSKIGPTMETTMTRTLLRVGHANCVDCLNDVAATLLARPHVQHVHTNAVPGCIAIDHVGDDIAALEDLVERRLHGFETAPNGEIIMTPATTAISVTCPHHPPGKTAGPIEPA